MTIKQCLQQSNTFYYNIVLMFATRFLPWLLHGVSINDSLQRERESFNENKWKSAARGWTCKEPYTFVMQNGSYFEQHFITLNFEFTIHSLI